MVKVSRSLKDAGYKLKQAENKIRTREGREPSLDELCRATGISREDAVMALDAAAEVESLYKPVYEGDGKQIQLLDQVAAKAGDGQWEDTEKNKLLDRMLLRQLLEELPEKDRLLIRMRYYEDKTQTQIAHQMGISQVQVSRMEKRILIRMRERSGVR